MLRFLSCLLLVPTILSAQTTHDDLAASLYTLRYGSLQGERGIWQYDLASKEYRPWRTLFGGNALSAFEDRIVVLGPAAYEFDLLTGRFLRRYALLPPGSSFWEFHGQIVPEKTASLLSIPAGIYGFPVCPLGDFGPTCRPLQPPGYLVPSTSTNYDLLLRRPIAPQDAQLLLAATLTSMGGNPLSQQRFVSLATDALAIYSHGPTATTFIWGERISMLRRVSDGLRETITDERQLDLRSPDYVDPIASTYSPRVDAFVQTLSYDKLPVSEDRLIQRQRLREAVTLDSSRTSMAPLPYALTTVPSDLPDSYTQVLPAIGEARGANGTDWRSDVWFYNPSPIETTFTVRRVSHPATQVTYTLPGHGSLKLARALATLGGGASGDGVTTDALVITSPYRWAEQLSVYSRTYTPAPEGGTFGQAVPGVPSEIGYSTHVSEFIDYVEFLHNHHIPTTNPSFILDLRVPGRFRHNFGAVNDLDRPVTIRLRDGVQFGVDTAPPGREERIVVPAHSVANVSIENLFSRDILNNNPPRLWVVADAPMPVWLSIVDNLSGDATFLPFELFDMQGSSIHPVTVPAVTHTPGANQTIWRTDLYGIFTDFENGLNLLDARATLLSRKNCSGGTRVDASLQGVAGIPNVPDDQVLPFYQSIFPDVAAQFPGCGTDSITGALRMPRGSWMAGYTRTYTTRADGATYGDILPFYPERGWPSQHFAGIDVSTATRVNIGLFNGLTYPVTQDLRLYTAEGEFVKQASITLQPAEGGQASLSGIFGPVADGMYGLSVLPRDSADGPGRSWTYISLVDNVTGDPTNWW